MRRQHFMVSDKQLEAIKKAAHDKGVSMSEILRAAIDAYMAKEEKK